MTPVIGLTLNVHTAFIIHRYITCVKDCNDIIVNKFPSCNGHQMSKTR